MRVTVLKNSFSIQGWERADLIDFVIKSGKILCSKVLKLLSSIPSEIKRVLFKEKLLNSLNYFLCGIENITQDLKCVDLFFIFIELINYSVYMN